MISVEEALSHIHSNLFKPGIETVSLTDACGRVLAEDIKADRDFPPFNRVMMDGIAIQFSAFNNGNRLFEIEDVQYAGSPQLEVENMANAIEVMTGAMLPSGTDTVIRYEDLEISNGMANVLVDNIKKGQNIHPQGSDQLKGDVLMESGTTIGSSEIGVLASVGKYECHVYSALKMAIISTGDELVDIAETPEEYQIRRSNNVAIAADIKSQGTIVEIFHLNDDQQTLKTKLQEVLNNFDSIILSGGVSKGKKDYLPQILEELGVKKHFHGVAQRPGKPFWFGVKNNVTVFALPGNPVSTYFCYHYYVKSWINKSYLRPSKNLKAELSTDFSFEPSLKYFLQVRLEMNGSKLIAIPEKGNGSGDLVNLLKADAFLELDANKVHFKAGEEFPIILFRSLG